MRGKIEFLDDLNCEVSRHDWESDIIKIRHHLFLILFTVHKNCNINFGPFANKTCTINTGSWKKKN